MGRLVGRGAFGLRGPLMPSTCQPIIYAMDLTHGPWPHDKWPSDWPKPLDAKTTKIYYTPKLGQYNTLTSVTSPSLMSLPYLYPKTLGIICSVYISLLVVTFPFQLSHILTSKQSTEVFKPDTCTHHVVIIVIIIVLTLYYSIMCHKLL